MSHSIAREGGWQWVWFGETTHALGKDGGTEHTATSPGAPFNRQ
jgi:hypothetical protein